MLYFFAVIKMYEYSRDIFYYETDRMGVVHHSNFVRWLEEARTAYFAEIGLPYDDTERRGLMSPITALNVRFLGFARFGDRFTVRVRMTRYTGVRFFVRYTVVNQNGDMLFEGDSAHAFVGADYRPVSMARAVPEKHEIMAENVEE